MTKTEALLTEAVNRIGELASSQSAPDPDRLDLYVEPANLSDCCARLTTPRWGYLSAISGLDSGPETGRLEVLYFFCNQAAVLTVRVPILRDHPVVPSICGVIPSATLFERELMEMFGVVCEGTPNPDRLFLPDDWPDGTYPLRKDFLAPVPPPAPEI